MKVYKISAAMLSTLLKKGGLDQDEQFKKLLESENDTDISEELFKRVGDALIGMHEAGNHPEIQKAVKEAVFKPTETKMLQLLKDAGLTDAEATQVLNGGDNAEKIAKVSTKLAELAKTGATKGLTEQQTEWVKIKSEYEQKLAEATNQITQLNQARETDTLHHGLDAFLLHSGKVKLRSDLPIQTQLRIIKDELISQSNGKGVLKVVEGKLQLMDKADPTKPYFEPGNATPYNWEEAAIKSVSDLGLVEKQPGNTDTIITTQAQPATGNTGYKAAIDANHDLIEKAMQSN